MEFGVIVDKLQVFKRQIGAKSLQNSIENVSLQSRCLLWR